MNGCYNKDGNICKRDDLLEDGITGFCEFTRSYPTCIFYKPSNADNIRTKSDEELARYLGGMGCPEGLSPNSQKCPIPLDCSDEDACYKCWLDWLKKEAINESND